MGYLTDELNGETAPIIQKRGRTYFAHGAVRLLDIGDRVVTARVQGSQVYRVKLSVADGFIDYSCTCPFFTGDLNACKHIWATAMAAEERGCLKKILESDDHWSSHGASDLLPGSPQRRARPAKGQAPGWKQQLQSIRHALTPPVSPFNDRPPPERELFYLIDADYTQSRQKLTLEVARRERKTNGEWGKLKSQRLYSRDVEALTDPADRRIAAMLFGARQDLGYSYSSYYDSAPSLFAVPENLWELALPLMCQTGRCLLRSPQLDCDRPLDWDDGPAWELCLKVERETDSERYRLAGSLRRGEAELDLAQPLLLLAGGLIFYDGRIARLNDHGAFAWVAVLRGPTAVSFSVEDSEVFLDELVSIPNRPRLELPAELQFETVAGAPHPRLYLKPGKRNNWSGERLTAELSFDYDGSVVPQQHRGGGFYQKEQRRLVTRDLATEAKALTRLKQLGFRKGWEYDRSDLQLAPDQLARVVRVLSAEGWHIEAQGSLYRTAGALTMQVNSGVDWFGIDGAAEFGASKVGLPRLLRAIKHGEQTVRLDDGSLGIIPEEWMKKYGMLAGLGTFEGDGVHFSRSQAGLLDALLASEPAVSFDAVFERVRRELRDFSGVAAAAPAGEFRGELRHYQLEGLGWLHFLQRFGFGGCLADDMGLGKTIQVLALLEARRELRRNDAENSPPPALVVVPRSLVFHWKEEAARFTPKLAILDHTGVARLKPGDHFENYDVVLTTYGTLRSDAVQFKDIHFDYCVLDEAQAIKNASTLAAKAVRLLKADHRLAMSGTPVENHLGELWSLFEFLNPGMLGTASVFARAGKNPDESTRQVLGKALRPFILRRTKGQVAPELPEKTEQTIYCDLEGNDKKLYHELRDFYRERLLQNGAGDNSGQYKIQVLEALLRLRQAACHPGLIDKKKVAEPSAKVDTLLAQLDQVLDENHKALVFSQFTSLLAIVRSRLDKQKIPYVYLDGRTRDRQAKVEEFQNDPNAKLFLISLKAGGLGLNLHAAEYVYLLDPWWNPAVESQAIDRVHRIGQTRKVFAYRIIARDTVEEKVLELQKSKRDLADAIITADNSVMRNLTRDDLELLLS
jgi:SNF2 domain-containing protein/helicase-like protein/SNF2 helicase associated protein/SWIM zinc finger